METKRQKFLMNAHNVLHKKSAARTTATFSILLFVTAIPLFLFEAQIRLFSYQIPADDVLEMHKQTTRPVEKQQYHRGGGTLPAAGEAPWAASSLPQQSATPSSSNSSFSSFVRRRRQIEFSDFTFESYLGHGQVATNLIVSLPPGEWAHELYNFSNSQRFIMKLLNSAEGTYGNREIEAFQKMNADPARARAIGVLPLVFSATNLQNPFQCAKGYACQPLPGSLDSSKAKRLQRPRYVDVEVLPLVKPELLFSRTRSMDEFITFFRSLLEQLDWAHNVGANCHDLNPYSNYFVRERDGGAVLFDWNEHTTPGEDVYGTDRGLHLCPPEGMAQRLHGKKMKLYQAHTVDVWQMGLLWAHILYFPCSWASDHLIPEEELLKTTILSIGGNTVAPMNATKDIDLASLVGLPIDIGQHVEFSPLLSASFKGSKACMRESWYLDDPNVPAEKKAQAFDLLKSMLKLSPYDRPTCDVLLRHPFLND